MNSDRDETRSGVASSRLPGLRDLAPAERLRRTSAAAGLDGDAGRSLGGEGSLPVETADAMIENVIGTFALPLGIATNFTVNGRDYLVPMAVEEPSVVAAASFMARIARENGGFHATGTEPVMRAQVQLLGTGDPDEARRRLLSGRRRIIEAANARDPVLVGLGGGCKEIEVQVFQESAVGAMVVLHLLVDVRDAMGANAVNSMAEAVAPLAEEITGGEARLRILSNLADLRTVSARVEVAAETLATETFEGRSVARGIVEACALAEVDPYRAATHNKGIMNGIDPVVIATGNDWRAIEAGAHAFAARGGRYAPLTRWEQTDRGDLIGRIELPMALGLVGGATKTHPAAQAALQLMKVRSARELAEVVAAVGLAQNMAALRALATEGIQRGHMALHARTIAKAAGAEGPEVERIAKAMVAAGVISVEKAKVLLVGGE